MRYALIQNGIVVNAIVADPDYVAPDGCTLVQTDTANIGDSYAGGVFMPGLPPALPPLSTAQLATYAASARFRKETGGITVSGVPIATDRESQAMLTGAYDYVSANASAVIKWKGNNGFVSLTAAQIAALALAAGAHVQACFAKEADVDAQIGATPATITTTAQIDAAFAALSTTY